MNLRQQINSSADSETTKTGQWWYLQPETLQPVQGVGQELPPAPSSALFDPTAAERILARAGALQEVHGQLLTRDQIEAVAHEIGIEPEFIRLAIEQEKNAAPLEQREAVKQAAVDPAAALARRRIAAALAVYAVFASLIFVTARSYARANEVVFFIALIVPYLLSLLLGIMGRSRRRGMALGAAVGTIFMTVLVVGSLAYGGRSMTLKDAPYIAVTIGVGAVLGLIGAQARRIVSRRQVSNRSRKIST